MQSCCFTGFQWEGTPVGREDTIDNHPVYITGDNKDRAILYNHDAFGWQLKNNRLLADHFAKEVGATVYLPDFFHGNAVGENDITSVPDGDSVKFQPRAGFDMGAWFAENGMDVRFPEVISVARALRKQYTWIGAVGYCWGGAINFKLASKDLSGLVDCVCIAHPGGPSEDEVRKIGVPVQILAPEHDPTFPPEMRDFCNTEIPKLGVDYNFQYFPGMVHGFATRCDASKAPEKRALEMAKNAFVYWLTTHAK